MSDIKDRAVANLIAVAIEPLAKVAERADDFDRRYDEACLRLMALFDAAQMDGKQKIKKRPSLGPGRKLAAPRAGNRIDRAGAPVSDPRAKETVAELLNSLSHFQAKAD